MSPTIPSALAALLAGTLASGCGSRPEQKSAPTAPAATAITVATVRQQTVNRVLRVTGTLMAAEEAEVAAETSGRVTSTPVERGSRVAEGTPLITLARIEAQAGAADAEASVAQLEARLAITPGEPFDIDKVPEVGSAKASRDLAEAEFARIRSLLRGVRCRSRGR